MKTIEYKSKKEGCLSYLGLETGPNFLYEQVHVLPVTFVPPVMAVFINLRPRVGTWASPYLWQ